jgi:hypothetical protein
MKRSRGVTAVCLLLAWSFVTGLARWQYVIASLSRSDVRPGWAELAMIALLFIEPISALTALVGLWRLRLWAAAAFGVWSILAALETGEYLAIAGSLAGMKGPAWAAVVALWVIAAAALFWLWLYVRRSIGAAAPPPEAPQ